MNTAIIITALIMGLTGSLHCAGMCGPIALIMPFHSLAGVKKWLAILLYHVGRITVYAALGVTLYSFKSFFNPVIQQYISIILGITLLLVGLLTFMPGSKVNIYFPWTGFVQKKLGKLLASPGLSTLFLTGMLNGLLPCGLVYMALSLSMTAQDQAQAILVMYSFGIGTIPMLVAITVLKSRVHFASSRIRQLVPVALFFMSALFILRGMNLGVPYLSPEISIEHNEVKARCCHK